MVNEGAKSDRSSFSKCAWAGKWSTWWGGTGEKGFGVRSRGVPFAMNAWEGSEFYGAKKRANWVRETNRRVKYNVIRSMEKKKVRWIASVWLPSFQVG